MTDYIQTYQNLLADADALPHGDARVAIIEKAMQLVDLHQEERLQFKIRLRYIREVHEAGGFVEKFVAIFPWLLAYTEKTESQFDKYEVLWYYKWVIGCMPNFPTVSRAQIESTLLDLRDRYRNVSQTDLVYHNYARDMYVDLGDFELAKAHQKEIEEIGGRDILSDCKACTLNSYVAYLVAIREIPQAIAAAQPLLNGTLSCRSVPQTTFARLIPEFLLLGRHDEAMGMASKLLKKIKKEDRDDYGKCYSLLGYMAVMKKHKKGIAIFQDHFEHSWRVKSKWGKFHFYAYAVFLFREVLKKSDITQVTLTLPSNFPLYSASNQYDIEVLLPWLEKEVKDLVATFNKRNGNTYFSDILALINSLETVVWE